MGRPVRTAIVGAGDFLTFGGSKLVRDHIGLGDRVDECSGWYAAGSDTAFLASMLDGEGEAAVAEDAVKGGRQIITRTRPNPGADGGISRHLLEQLDGKTVSVTHQVETDGEIVHQHQRYVGANGTERYFPPEWTEYPYIGY